MIAFNVILYDDFETLDVFGPVGFIGKMPKTYRIGYYSLDGGVILSSQNTSINTLPFTQMDTSGVLLIPGGMGTRKLVGNDEFIETIKSISQRALYVLTVCTGSALLAKTGLLKGKKATGNKLAFNWVCGNDNEVNWIKKARWTNDGKYYTSSGVSAGMDMILRFISDIHGEQTARDLCGYVEYVWNDDETNDPFAVGN